MSIPRAVIVGAGPAGLTAAYELLTRTDVKPVVLEESDGMGGISRTVVSKGNRIDIGGHRFFTKSDRVMQWWLERLPVETDPLDPSAEHPNAPNHPRADPDRVMLVRQRKSRIYWRRRLFDYPLTLSADTIRKLGFLHLSKVGLSYLRSAALPIRPETTLEEFLINRFGRVLFKTFFKAYTEKVWGVPCHQIPADWGAQRIKRLSIRQAIRHALSRAKKSPSDVRQKDTETSLIERFLYPKLGPGQMWETVAQQVRDLGGRILTQHRAVKFHKEGKRITDVLAEDRRSGQTVRFPADYVFSSMPVKDLAAGLGPDVPQPCREIAAALPYRDFITVGLLASRFNLQDEDGRLATDNWIYIQDPDVQVGRLQIFNNWSPWLVADPTKVWLGLEYFCYETDPIWSSPDETLIDLGKTDLARIGLLDPRDLLHGCVIRMPKAYPAYFGSYSRFHEVRRYLDGIENLFCIGRNGQHRYNNQDHSMLCAMTAVDSLCGLADKSAIWNINVETQYHEEIADQ